MAKYNTETELFNNFSNGKYQQIMDIGKNQKSYFQYLET